jgi:uncharacterized DUF497 family protein
MGVKYIWDPGKARANLRKHGVSFEEAAEAIDDPLAIESIDADIAYGEVRIKLLGSSRGQVLVVLYVERSAGVRIISARKATSHEQQHYHASLHRWR